MHLCCDYIQKYSRPIGFLYFYRPINIILSDDWSVYIKDITRRLPKSVPKHYSRPIVGRWSADTLADDKWRATIGRRSANTSADDISPFKYVIGQLIGRSSADRRPFIGRLPKPQNCRPMEKNYNKVVIIYFLSADEKRAKIWHFIGRSSAGLM